MDLTGMKKSGQLLFITINVFCTKRSLRTKSNARSRSSRNKMYLEKIFKHVQFQIMK